MASSIRLTAVGWRAGAALASTGGVARVLAVLTASTYLDAGGEILWLGRPGSARHARATLASAAPAIDGGEVALDSAGLEPWRPRPVGTGKAAVIEAGAAQILRALRGRESWIPVTASGLGSLLAGKSVSFPLDRMAGAVRAMADACARGDAAAAGSVGESLLGLGPGLTPSGDDFVGGVLFARRILAPEDAAWASAASALVKAARARTHPISATLMADLARGEGHEPLHDLMHALADGEAESRAGLAIERLTRLGHSSGWDMLAGVLVGLAGPTALA